MLGYAIEQKDTYLVGKNHISVTIQAFCISVGKMYIISILLHLTFLCFCI